MKNYINEWLLKCKSDNTTLTRHQLATLSVGVALFGGGLVVVVQYLGNGLTEVDFYMALIVVVASSILFFSIPIPKPLKKTERG